LRVHETVCYDTVITKLRSFYGLRAFFVFFIDIAYI